MPISWPVLATVAIMNIITTYNDFLWPLIVIRSMGKQVVSVGLRYLGAGWESRMAGYIVPASRCCCSFPLARYYIEGITTGPSRPEVQWRSQKLADEQQAAGVPVRRRVFCRVGVIICRERSKRMPRLSGIWPSTVIGNGVLAFGQA